MQEINIEYVPIGQIIPYENNARAHGDADTGAIMKSIEEFGFNDPIGVWKNIIVEGHGRLIAAKRLGMTEVPIIRLDHLTDEQRKAYALAHNKTAELSSWDFDILNTELSEIANIDMTAFGFDDEGVKSFDETDDVIEDEPPEDEEVETRCKPGQIWKLGEHRLMCGDSTKPEDVKKLMDGEQADLVVTDPPYNVDYESTNKNKKMKIVNDHMSSNAFRLFLNDAFATADSVLKPGGAFYIWHGSNEASNFIGACEDVGWSVRQQLMWNKNAFTLGRQDYQWKHEPCLYGWKSGAPHYFTSERNLTTVMSDEHEIDPKKMKKDELIRIVEDFLSDKVPTTVINVEKPTSNDIHPTMKPVKLIAQQVHNSSRPGERVLDLFGGSGSTLIACEQLGRRCYMNELDPHYCDVIIQRWENLTGRTAEMIEPA